MPKTTVVVKLVGTDGNAFAIIGKVKRALEAAGHVGLAREYIKEAMAGDYDHLLRVTMQYVEVE